MSQVIYKIVNLVNDKFYVGSTIHKKVRFRQHRKLLRGNRHHCKHLQAAWNKYGEEKFDFCVVEEVPSEKSLQEAEDRWLKEHVGQKYCYNAGYSSDAPWRNAPAYKTPNFGKPVTEEQKQQISQTLKDFYAQDYYNHPRVGKQHTEETKAKISASKKVNPVTYWAGKERSEETRAKISASQKGREGRKYTDAEREAIRQRTLGNQNWLGKTHTEESKDKMRRPLIGVDPSGVRHEYTGTKLAGEALGIAYTMLVRVIKDGGRVAKGKLAGWQFFYADEGPSLVEIPDEFRHLPRTRQHAKEQGAKEYFTGVPCTHGHLSPRLTKGTCVACRKAGLG